LVELGGPVQLADLADLEVWVAQGSSEWCFQSASQEVWVRWLAVGWRGVPSMEEGALEYWGAAAGLEWAACLAWLGVMVHLDASCLEVALARLQEELKGLDAQAGLQVVQTSLVAGSVTRGRLLMV